MGHAPIFVYGTLRPGAESFWRIEPYAAHIEEACMSGVAMYDLGADPWPYAALTSAEDSVIGAVVWLCDDADVQQIMAELDAYEVCDLDDNERSMYTRRVLPAQTLASGERVDAWIYLAQGDALALLQREHLVAGGDWLTWTARKRFPSN